MVGIVSVSYPGMNYAIYVNGYKDGIGEYLPLEISDRLIPYPRWFIKDENEWKALLSQSDVHVLYTFILLAITWGLCFRINKKRDL